MGPVEIKTEMIQSKTRLDDSRINEGANESRSVTGRVTQSGQSGEHSVKSKRNRTAKLS